LPITNNEVALVAVSSQEACGTVCGLVAQWYVQLKIDAWRWWQWLRKSNVPDIYSCNKESMRFQLPQPTVGGVMLIKDVVAVATVVVAL
jgi:hypothetical protein